MRHHPPFGHIFAPFFRVPSLTLPRRRRREEEEEEEPGGEEHQFFVDLPLDEKAGFNELSSARTGSSEVYSREKPPRPSHDAPTPPPRLLLLRHRRRGRRHSLGGCHHIHGHAQDEDHQGVCVRLRERERDVFRKGDSWKRNCRDLNSIKGLPLTSSYFCRNDTNRWGSFKRLLVCYSVCYCRQQRKGEMRALLIC